MRARKKAEQPEQPRLTRAAKEEQREKWRQAKAKWWVSLHPQKQCHQREKRAQPEREKRANKRVSAAAASQPSSSIPQASTCTPLSSWSQGARRKAKAWAYATFPHSPCRLVETLNDIVHSLAPRKKQLFKTLQPGSLEHRIRKSVIFELKKNNTRRNKDLLHTRHVLLNTCQKYLNLRGSSSIRAVSKGSSLSLTESKHMKQEKMKRD
ncbi:uncharacterized protein LOC132865879 [Neoarius graeffei]|uniref:uncharacterized protein LOC132865879 n=1 Tax=Neoarius graeffei TaxID=443677 RepID=UPI00298CE63B|nr:uncharacterized protein LOC132865879 [Neoarius graeffei]